MTLQPTSEDLDFFQARLPTKSPTIPRSILDLPVKPEPDALVLVCVEERCQRCGCEYLAHGKNLLLRTGRNMARANEGFTLWSHLPRELLVVKETILSCLQCFQPSEMPPTHKRSLNGTQPHPQP